MSSPHTKLSTKIATALGSDSGASPLRPDMAMFRDNAMTRHQGKPESLRSDGDQLPAGYRMSRSRAMYIEDKSGGLEGEARIGRVYFSKSGKTLYYRELT